MFGTEQAICGGCIAVLCLNLIRGIYRTLLQAPHAYLKKAWEKQCFSMQASHSLCSCDTCMLFLFSDRCYVQTKIH